MPKIPEYSQRVQQAALPGVRSEANATAASFGGNDLQLIRQGVQAIENVGAKLFIAQEVNNIEKENEKLKAGARDAVVSAQRATLEHLNQVKQLQGKEATNVYQPSVEKINEIKRTYTKDLNDYQKDLFVSTFADFETRAASDVLEFESTATKKYKDDTMDAENKLAIDKAVSFRADPNVLAESEQTIRLNTANKFKGMDKAVIEKAVSDGVNNMYATMAKAIGESSPSEAAKFIDTHKAKLNPLMYEAYKKDFTEKAENEWLQNQTNILAEMPLDKALEAINKVPDAAKATKLRKLVKERQEEKSYFQELESKKAFESEVDKVFTDPFKYKVPLAMNAKDQEHLYDLRNKMIKEKRGEEVKTDWKRYHELINLSPSEFSKIDMKKELPNLAPTEFKELTKMQLDSRYANQVQSLTNYVNSFTKAEAKEDFEQAAFIRGMFQKELDKYPAEERNKIETWNKVRDELVLSVDVKGSIFDSKNWKAKQQGKTIIEPTKRPEKLPPSAIWVDKEIDGTSYRGWEFTNPQGIKFLVRPDGQMFKVE